MTYRSDRTSGYFSSYLTQDNVAEAAQDGPQSGDEERPGNLLHSPKVLVLHDGVRRIDGDDGGGRGRVGVGGRSEADLVAVLGRRGVCRQEGPDEEGAEEEADPDHGVEGVGEGTGLVRAHRVDDDAGVGRDEGAQQDVLRAPHRHQHAERAEEREDADDQAVESDGGPDEGQLQRLASEVPLGRGRSESVTIHSADNI